jgi:hypothetical protein
MSKINTTTLAHLRPVPEYLSHKPHRRSYNGPPIVELGPPLPAHLQAIRDAAQADREAEVLADVLEQLRRQYGAGAVLYSCTAKG